MSQINSIILTYDPLLGPLQHCAHGWIVGERFQERGSGDFGTIALIQPQRITVLLDSGEVQTWIPNELIKYCVSIPADNGSDFPESGGQDMTCTHANVEIIDARPLEGETYGDLSGKCLDCGRPMKAYGMIFENPGYLERRGEWEADGS